MWAWAPFPLTLPPTHFSFFILVMVKEMKTHHNIKLTPQLFLSVQFGGAKHGRVTCGLSLL